MRTVDRSVTYSIPEWRAWLWRHGIDINNVESVDLYDSHAVAHTYALNKDGQRYAIGNVVARAYPITFKYQSAPPS